MSTATAVPVRTVTRSENPDSIGQVTFAHVIRSEWIKLRSLRSTWYMLGAAAATMIGLSVLFAYVAGTTDPDPRFPLGPSTVLSGSLFAQLLICVLGVLFVGSEYSTGMIRSTLSAVPRRIPVVLAKLGVFAAITFVTMLASTLIAFFLGNAVLDQYAVGGFSITDDTSVRVILATAVYLTILGVLGTALGWIMRSTASAIASVLGLLLVVPVVAQSLGDVGATISKYMPSNAGSAFATSVPTPDMLSVWAGFAVLVIWALAALAAAMAVLRQRDV
jgi:ABC-type transport system involved in multi-copper enzyme maturation permease subunit